MNRLTLSLCAMAAAMLPISADAIAPQVALGQAQYTIGISGFVPVICRASVDAVAVPVSGNTQSLGSLHEFCNSSSGYQVVATYSPSLAGAKLLVDGNPVPLNASGSRIVSRSNGAGLATRDLALQLPKGASSGTLSFRIEPL